MTDTTNAMREALAFKLFQSDWPHKSAVNWNGDGTKDNPGHAELKDRCFERYCALADVSIAALTAPAQADTMQIEEGKRYVTRFGRITPPAKAQRHSKDWPWFFDGFGSFSHDGRFNGATADPKDIMALAPAQADIHATTDDELRKIYNEEKWRAGITSDQLYSEIELACGIAAIAAMRRVAHSPTPPRVDEKEMREMWLTEVSRWKTIGWDEQVVRAVISFGRALMEKCNG